MLSDHGLSQLAGSMTRIPGGRFQMGSNAHYPEEAPVRTVRVEPFEIDTTPVTNRAFAAFVEATGYVTFCERRPDPSHYPGISPDMMTPGSIVFHMLHTDEPAHPESWWRYVHGASWRTPYGPGQTIEDLPDHPVVHIAWEDALRFAQWAGKRLPTEAEAEFASRAGLDRASYAWGEDLLPEGAQVANFWRSGFPFEHPDQRRPPYTTPVGRFPPNNFGLFDTIGNVWEWTSTHAPESNAGSIPGANLESRSSHTASADCCSAATRTSPSVYKVLKGGSHLCAPNYCQRYRPAARWFQPTDTTTSHVGFRCARSVEPGT